MIDFVRLNYKDKSIIENYICSEENFKELRVILEKHSGEIEYPYKAQLETMDIVITEKNVRVMNSLHKLKNFRYRKGNRNHNDFKYNELCDTIDFIQQKLPNIEKARLSKLEFGLNIELDNPAEYLIRENILMHNNKTHSHNEKFEGKGEFKQFNHSRYDVKVYDKAKQYNLHKPVLRFEIKHKKSRSFNPIGIYNLLDLKSRDSLYGLFNDLMMRFEQLTIIDEFRNNINVGHSTKQAIESYLSHNYWEEISSSSTRARHKKKFLKILKDNDLLQTKSELRSKLISKFEYLINN